MAKDPVEQHDDGWGYWDETWSDWHGGFKTEADARADLKRYCKEVLGNDFKPDD